MNIAALKEAAERATPGPWQIGRLGDEKMSHVVDFGPPPTSPFMVLLDGTPAKPQMGFTGFGPSGVAHSDDGSSEANAAFIALANPSAILSLIERYEAFRVVVENLHTALTEDFSLINGGDSDDVAWFVERARLALSNPTETVK